jgi:group I intron endonuclease
MRLKEHFKCPGSCILLENAIKKYGQDAMKVEVLLEVNDDLLDNYEIEFINTYNTIEPHGYNIRSGGSHGKHSIISRMRMKEAKMGEKNHNFGKQSSDEAKNAISNAKSGERHHFYGKELTLEHKKNLSLSHKSRTDLPMYVVYVKPRIEHYVCSGYAVVNHPTLANKYFTSKKLTEEEKLEKAISYLNSA